MSRGLGDVYKRQVNSDAPVENDVVSNLPEGQPWYTRMIASITEAGKQ